MNKSAKIKPRRGEKKFKMLECLFPMCKLYHKLISLYIIHMKITGLIWLQDHDNTETE